MAEALKHLINARSVASAAALLAARWPGFDERRFRRLAGSGLEALELKARALQLCTALEATLPEDFERAAGLVEICLQGDDALQGWVLWPFGEFVARRGLHQPERALQVLRALTPRFTAEFAIRPFIVQHPALVFETLARWAQDPDEHVRRLVSEGSRPRLPWGLRLQALVRDPTPTLPLLAALQDDPSEYVRRSVANHLNDIAKDHPDLVAGWLEQHLPSAPPERRALLRHASRSLIKQGHVRTLAAWGLGAAFQGQVTLKVSPARIVLGEAVTLSLQLLGSSAQPQRLEVDYAVHHVKADGRTTPKVFKGWRLELPPGGHLPLSKRHAVRPITTRRYHPGRHVVDVRINGQVVAQAAFTLALASPAARPAG
jgi:3-methyladenine DNA glycosylase AlkC